MTSFDDFVRANAASLHATAWLLSGNAEDARDLVQSALLVVFRRWEKLSHDNLRGYAFTVMGNEYRRTARLSRRRARAEEAAAGRGFFEVEYRDERDVLLRYLARLGPKQRAAVVLRIVGDLPVAEVAQVLDCSPETVRSQTSRALAAMRAAIAADVAMEG